jgi:NAD(P)-dependent dehydrogenase (short-subunit alcohol dehydrogenase family)
MSDKNIMNDMFNLTGKVAVVTGGSRGIGKMIAEEFVCRGVRTYITSRKLEACLQTAEELSEHGECIALATLCRQCRTTSQDRAARG